MKPIHNYFIITLLFGCALLNAQTFPYSVSVLNEPYQDLTDATELTSGPWDDPELTVPIGFDFAFFGDTTDVLYFVEDFLGGILTTTADVSTGLTTPLIAYASDLIDRGAATGEHLSPISHKTEGIPGSQIFKLEWKNAGFFNEIEDIGTNTNYVNLQLWIYEGSNDIEIRFGPNNIDLDADVHDFNGSALIGFIEDYDYSGYDWGYFWYLTGPSPTPKVAVVEGYDDLYSIKGFSEDPADGTVYHFSTGITSTNEKPGFGKFAKIYPTLADEVVFVEVLGPQMSNGTISVTNTLGHLVAAQPFQAARQTVDIGALAAGYYFVTIKTENGIFTEKIFKK